MTKTTNPSSSAIALHRAPGGGQEGRPQAGSLRPAKPLPTISRDLGLLAAADTSGSGY